MRIFCTKFYNVGKDIFLTGGWDDLVKVIHLFLDCSISGCYKMGFQVWDLRVKTGCVKNIIGPHICGDALDTRVSHTIFWIPTYKIFRVRPF